MLKRIGIISILLILVLMVTSFITSYIDSGRVTTNHEPKFTIKMVSEDGGKVTYYGLFYKVIRYVGVSPNEPYESNIGAKMGSWFMKYELEEKKNIIVEYEDKKILIDKQEDIDTIYNIVINSRYDLETCNGISTHIITIDNEVYNLKEGCSEIQKDFKQAAFSKDDLNTLLSIIESY